MGYPLYPFHICAISLYCAGDCYAQFGKDQMNFNYDKWKWMDYCLQQAIEILSRHERREESKEYLYSGLNKVKFNKIQEEIKEGYFVNYVSTSDDFEVAQMFRGDEGCILKFHPSMRMAGNIRSCQVDWISAYDGEREILFMRSHFSELAKITNLVSR